MAPTLRLMADTFAHQDEQGHYFLLENPESGTLWGQVELAPLWKLDNLVSDVGRLCAYGKVSSSGEPLRKPMRWMSNHEGLLAALSRKSPGGRTHQTVQGRRPRACRPTRSRCAGRR